MAWAQWSGETLTLPLESIKRPEGTYGPYSIETCMINVLPGSASFSFSSPPARGRGKGEGGGQVDMSSAGIKSNRLGVPFCQFP